MDISAYFNPIDREGHDFSGEPDHNRFGNLVTFFTEKDKFPYLENLNLAIIGITEERSAVQNEGCGTGADRVRDYLYNLFSHWPQLNIADLGNLRNGHSIEDTYFALKDVVSYLVRQNIVPIIIGGSQDLTYANYLAYENLGKVINFAAVDPLFDLGQDEKELSSRSYLSKIILHKPNFLFSFTNIGFQSYFVDQDAIALMKNLYFDFYRLGKVRTNMEEAEPMIRNADFLSFDISAIRKSDAPGNFNANPNGFFGEEACQICRYAGMSDKLSSIGFYEYNPIFDDNGQTANLLAQMIWYFIDGYANRQNELPEESTEEYIRFTVNNENFEDGLVFLKSKKTERWWMEVQPKTKLKYKYRRHQFIPCSYQDYQHALNMDVPDRWLKLQQKMM